MGKGAGEIENGAENAEEESAPYPASKDACKDRQIVQCPAELMPSKGVRQGRIGETGDEQGGGGNGGEQFIARSSEESPETLGDKAPRVKRH